MIQEEGRNFLQNASPAKFAELRKKIVDAVLHTDMTKHFATVGKIQSTAASKPWNELEPSTQWEVLMYGKNALTLYAISTSVDPCYLNLSIKMYCTLSTAYGRHK